MTLMGLYYNLLETRVLQNKTKNDYTQNNLRHYEKSHVIIL